MWRIWKNWGLIIIAAGILLLLVPHFIHLQTNATLLSGWILVPTGIVAYIICKKKNCHCGLDPQSPEKEPNVGLQSDVAQGIAGQARNDKCIN